MISDVPPCGQALPLQLSLSLAGWYHGTPLQVACLLQPFEVADPPLQPGLADLLSVEGETHRWQTSHVAGEPWARVEARSAGDRSRVTIWRSPSDAGAPDALERLLRQVRDALLADGLQLDAPVPEAAPALAASSAGDQEFELDRLGDVHRLLLSALAKDGQLGCDQLAARAGVDPKTARGPRRQLEELGLVELVTGPKGRRRLSSLGNLIASRIKAK